MIFTYRAPFAPGAEPPKRLLVAKWGRNASVKGDFVVGERTASLLPRMQAALGFGDVALDFEHNTCPDKDGKKPIEPVKIAAVGKPVVVPGEGIYIDSLQWTPEGREAALGGHYVDLSPAVKKDERGEVIFVHSAALCRQGAVEDLHLFSAILGTRELSIFSAIADDRAEKAAHPSPSIMDYKKLLLALLGLSETATDADITAGAKAFADKLSAIPAATQAIEAHSASIKALTQRLDQAERDSIAAAALAAGKIIPHSAAALPIEQYKTLVAELPAGQVPLDKRTPEGIKTYSAAPQSGESDAAVMRALGLRKESWEKFSR